MQVKSLIDLKHKEDSSLEYLAKSVKSQPEEGVEVVEFDESEIVRHRLTSYFIDIFKEPEKPKQEFKPKPKKQKVKEYHINKDEKLVLEKGEHHPDTHVLTHHHSSGKKRVAAVFAHYNG
mgnify:CR=1 FL=1